RRDGAPNLVPITEMQVKGSIARPSLGEVVPAGETYRVCGAAWTGESEVAKVEISIDAGKTWSQAKLLDKAVSFAWRLWEFAWKTPEKPGRAVLLARATDRRGVVQPLERDSDRRHYMITHAVPVAVEVR